MSLFDFVDGLGSYGGGGSGFLLSIFLFLFTPFGNLRIYLVYFGAFFLTYFIYTIFNYPLKKNAMSFYSLWKPSK